MLNTILQTGEKQIADHYLKQFSEVIHELWKYVSILY